MVNNLNDLTWNSDYTNIEAVGACIYNEKTGKGFYIDFKADKVTEFDDFVFVITGPLL